MDSSSHRVTRSSTSKNAPKVMDEKSAKRRREILPEESPSQKKKEIMQHEAQDWDYRIDRKSWPVGRIMVSPKIDVIGKLNAKLKESQKQLFKETCFGAVLRYKRY
ncbi:hypothetical protein Adt_48361 [Abeliophyllum distichum]|uniref:Uncharacterized protein n=1 Tax=Abeliophyllum distichum TaxID=126358 RepID=A0ABD1NSS3_9LAMI